MNPEFNNPFENFVRQRNAKNEIRSVRHEHMSANNIDDMLEALDRVLQDDVTVSNVAAEEPAPIIATIEAILEEISNACGRLEQAAKIQGDREFSGFAEQLRPKLDRLLMRVSQYSNPAVGMVEYELDFEALHRFMLSPDVSSLAP